MAALHQVKKAKGCHEHNVIEALEELGFGSLGIKTEDFLEGDEINLKAALSRLTAGERRR
jgi:hypothetical protein